MPKYACARLSAQDNNFLLWERANVDIVPDLDRFTGMMRSALERVAGDAGVTLSDPPQKAVRRARSREKKADAPASAPNANGNDPVASA